MTIGVVGRTHLRKREILVEMTVLHAGVCDYVYELVVYPRGVEMRTPDERTDLVPQMAE